MKNAYPVMTQRKELIVVFAPISISMRRANIANDIEMARDAIGLMGIDM